MARKAKSEGTEVRIAMNGPDVEHDQLIGEIERQNRDDTARASSAGVSRQAIGEFLEETGMNSKAFSWLRSILKQKTTDKAMDIIRSLETGLPMVKAHLGGQQSEMPFDPVDEPAPVEPAVEEQVQRFARPSYEADPDFAGGDDPEIQGEADDFEAALAEAAE